MSSLALTQKVITTSDTNDTYVYVDHEYAKGEHADHIHVYEQHLDETIEFQDDYGAGKLHPVHFGDLYGEALRYKILRKLGAGSFSTVWLARDRT